MWASQVALLVKNLPVNAGDARDTGLIPGSGRPLRIGNDNHSSTLAWKIRWAEEPSQPLHGADIFVLIIFGKGTCTIFFMLKRGITLSTL